MVRPVFDIRGCFCSRVRGDDVRLEIKTCRYCIYLVLSPERPASRPLSCRADASSELARHAMRSAGASETRREFNDYTCD